VIESLRDVAIQLAALSPSTDADSAASGSHRLQFAHPTQDSNACQQSVQTPTMHDQLAKRFPREMCKPREVAMRSMTDAPEQKERLRGDAAAHQARARKRGQTCESGVGAAPVGPLPAMEIGARGPCRGMVWAKWGPAYWPAALVDEK
jgi:hypothetical protein